MGGCTSSPNYVPCDNGGGSASSSASTSGSGDDDTTTVVVVVVIGVIVVIGFVSWKWKNKEGQFMNTVEYHADMSNGTQSFTNPLYAVDESDQGGGEVTLYVSGHDVYEENDMFALDMDGAYADVVIDDEYMDVLDNL